jgi:hypothetical protein
LVFIQNLASFAKVGSKLAGRVKTKSIFSVVREDDAVFAHETQTYDGKDELN